MLVLATGMQAKLTEGEQARLNYMTTSNVEACTHWESVLFSPGGYERTIWPGAAPLGKSACLRPHFRGAQRHAWLYALRGRTLRLVG